MQVSCRRPEGQFCYDATMSQVNSKWMMVVVERHILWKLWAIDFVQKAVRAKQDIIILDLSGFRLRRHESNSKYLLTRLYRKNRIESILRKIAYEEEIEIVYPRFCDHFGIPRRKFHSENSLSFLNGLDSQYFEELGVRITSESQLQSKILARSKLIYDRVFKIVTNVIAEKGITKVIVPGGRTLIPNAVIAGANTARTSCAVLEQVTSKSTRYLEFQLDFRQNMIPRQLEIDRSWAGGDESKYEVAQNYLEHKLQSSKLGRDFTVQFDSNLEITIPKNKKIATIFVGSGFEMAPLGIEVKSTQLGIDQQKSILKTFNKIAQEYGFSVLLRGHPPHLGLEKMSLFEDEEWAEFCSENEITHLSAFSKVDSYKLMKISDINVVYASTVGIDSIIQGYNTLVLANTDWAHLVPELCAFDEESIRNRFNDFQRLIKVEKIYPYAYFMECGGIEMSAVEYSNEGSLYFEGEEIGAPRSKFLEKIFKRKLRFNYRLQ